MINYSCLWHISSWNWDLFPLSFFHSCRNTNLVVYRYNPRTSIRWVVCSMQPTLTDNNSSLRPLRIINAVRNAWNCEISPCDCLILCRRSSGFKKFFTRPSSSRIYSLTFHVVVKIHYLHYASQTITRYFYLKKWRRNFTEEINFITKITYYNM